MPDILLVYYKLIAILFTGKKQNKKKNCSLADGFSRPMANGLWQWLDERFRKPVLGVSVNYANQ